MIRVFIQARMHSTRFPGKVLAPLNGYPIIRHVVSRVGQVIQPNCITVATSTEPSDDPLAVYVRDIGISVFRGPLDNVFTRFQMCLKENPCNWFFRICADSPLLDSALLQTMLTYRDRAEADLVTNVFPRTFPKGQSVEMLRAEMFAAIDSTRLSTEEQEHPTKFYYDHPAQFRIINLESAHPELASTSLVVDTLDDLRRLEKLALERV